MFLNRLRDIIQGQGSASRDDPYEPTVADVFLVKRILARIGNLPIEITDIVIDHAEYWPHTHTTVEYPGANGMVVPSSGNSSPDRFLCRTSPLGFTRAPAEGVDAIVQYSTAPTPPRPLPNQDPAHPGHDATCLPETIKTWLPGESTHITEHPCRKIVFSITSRDQGWCSDSRIRGTYTGSFTWFDVGLERYGRAPDGESDSPPRCSQFPGALSPMPADAQLYSISPEPDQTAQYGAPLYRFPMLPDSNYLQKNRVAVKDWTTHTIEWSWRDGGGPSDNFDADNLVQDRAQRMREGTAAETTDAPADTATEPEEHPLTQIGRGPDTGDGEFVRNLRIGDVVTIWAKARFRGWQNRIRRVDVKVYWAV